VPDTRPPADYECRSRFSESRAQDLRRSTMVKIGPAQAATWTGLDPRAFNCEEPMLSVRHISDRENASLKRIQPASEPARNPASRRASDPPSKSEDLFRLNLSILVNLRRFKAAAKIVVITGITAAVKIVFSLLHHK
jgi:hypothetical protein